VVRSPTFQQMRRLRDEGKLPRAQMGCFVAPPPKEALYNQAQNPYALENLATEPGHAATLAELRKVLEERQRETGDRMPDQLAPDRFDRELGTPLRRK